MPEYGERSSILRYDYMGDVGERQGKSLDRSSNFSLGRTIMVERYADIMYIQLRW